MVTVIMMVMRMIITPQQVLLLDPLEPRLLLLVLQLEEVVPRCKLVLPAVFNQIWPCCTWSCCTWSCCTGRAVLGCAVLGRAVLGCAVLGRCLAGIQGRQCDGVLISGLLDRYCIKKCISVADGCFPFLSFQVTCCPCDMWVSN